MTKKKTAKNAAQKAAGGHSKAKKPARKSAALNNYAATMTDLGQLFTNPPNMENFMTKGKSQFDKLSNEINNAGRGGFDAFNKSLTLFTKGFEEMARASMALAQSAAEKQSQMIKDAMTVKSINEWTDIQNRIAQENFDDCIAACTKLSEMGVKVLTESSEPINSHFNKGVKKAAEAMAA